jgi:hypothetical protein
MASLELDHQVIQRRDDREEFASLVLLHQLAISPFTQTTFFDTLHTLTNRTTRRLRTPFSPDPSSASSTRPFTSPSSLSYATRAAHALAPHTFAPLAYFALLSDPKAGAYERIVLRWAEDRVRERAEEMMRRAYLEMGLGWAGRLVGCEEAEVERWAVDKGLKVEDHRLKLR